MIIPEAHVIQWKKQDAKYQNFEDDNEEESVVCKVFDAETGWPRGQMASYYHAEQQTIARCFQDDLQTLHRRCTFRVETDQVGDCFWFFDIGLGVLEFLLGGFVKGFLFRVF